MPSGNPSRSVQISAMTGRVRGRIPAGPDGPGPFDEQAYRGRVAVTGPVRDGRQGPDGVFLLAAEVQR